MADHIVVMNAGRIDKKARPKISTSARKHFVARPSVRHRSTCSMVMPRAEPSKWHQATIAVASSATDQSCSASGRRACTSTVPMPARIDAVEPMGREVLYTADCSLGIIRFLEAGADARHAEGDNIALSFLRTTLAVRQDERGGVDALLAA
jgi:hypothetical protein